jgi:hypothetical protein
MVARWGLRQEVRLDGALRTSGYHIGLKDAAGTKSCC